MFKNKRGEKLIYPVIDGAESFFIKGNSVGLLLLHGFLGTPQSVKDLGEQFAELGYTVYAPRLKGHGTHYKDVEKGTFFNEEKMHQLNYKGTFFSVRGPLNIARSIQGQPVIVQAGSSPSGQRLAARTAEVVFIHKDSKEEAKKYYRSLKSQMKTFNRHPESLAILQGISPIIGRTEAETHEKYTELQRLLSPYEGLQFLSGYMGNIDFTKYPINMLASEINFPKVNGIQSQFDEMKRIMKEEKLTVGDLYYRFVGAGRKDAFVGTPHQIADEMERWIEEGAADGFMLQCPLLPEGLEDFVQYVVPLLQKKGIYRREYEGTTLREHLGLRKPKNRYGRSVYKGSL